MPSSERALEKKLIRKTKQIIELANQEIMALADDQQQWETRYVNNHVPRVGMTGKVSVSLAPGRYGGVGTRSNRYQNIHG